MGIKKFDVRPLFYVDKNAVFQRPTKNVETGNTRMGFRVCEVCDGVNPIEVCAILNAGQQPGLGE